MISSALPSPEPLVAVEGLTVEYRHQTGWRPVIRDLDLQIHRGEAVGLAGESGCGKSTLVSLLLGENRPGRRIAAGEIRIEGEELFGLPAARLRALRGRHIGFVPQNGGTSLTPTRRIATLFDDVLRAHRPELDAPARRARAHAQLAAVGFPDPDGALVRFPHQFSGGQQQRIALALALASEPGLLLLDEPTTGQDAQIRRGLIELLWQIRRRSNVTLVFVSHDLLTLADLCDRIDVMSEGRIVESGSAAAILQAPAHAYTRRLVAAVPRLDEPPPWRNRDRPEAGRLDTNHGGLGFFRAIQP
ncbi:ABC transporter ATP-binding protein [Ancylobacter sonchi]|uniref:ATP-binding cassette domain-containing protein n=1 Tax=Ancylobacter sonchi TaxID=1937790 RepID=UPI001BD6AA28|nr:ABC transporter ATP-binding protein [Ancylobacter sonchi]MBS7535975.1 ABC transporter ATP-binding protein [Ancylobacter sonchi]